MYLEYFSLSRLPFQNTPDPEFFFASHSHRQALASMVFGIEHAQGFVLVIGDVGTGKTLLVQALKQELGDKHMLVEISNPWTTPENVLATIRARLDLPISEDSPSFESLKKRLLALSKEGQRVILIIDEAHQLSERMIEGIRLLSNIETADEKLLQIVFLGQNELASMLSRYSMRQVQQRVSQSYHLQCLTADETTEYIQHRLRIAGGTPLLFPLECIKLIYQESGGAPRVINRLCDTCLLAAFGRKVPQVTPEIVREAIAGLHLERTIAQAEAQAIAPQSEMQPLAASVPPPASPTLQSEKTEEIPATPAAQPAQSQSTEPLLPFQFPGGSPSSPPVETKTTPTIQRKHLYLALGAGLSAGALAIWLLLQFGAGPSKPSNETASSSRAQQTTVEPAPRPSPAPRPPLATPEAPPSQPASPRPAALPLRDIQIPLPGSKIAALPFEEATIPAHGGVSMLASSKFGTWNETIRELIAASNPEISANLESLAGGGRIRLPKLSRDGLIVKDSEGHFFVYFASFENREEAQLNLEAIRRTWNDVQLIQGTRASTPTHRIYIGPFSTMNEAAAAVGSLWFKHLPTLN